MKKKQINKRKLTVNSETVRKLGESEMTDVAGGYTSPGVQTKTLETAVCAYTAVS